MSVIEQYINSYRRILPQDSTTESKLKSLGFSIVEKDLEVKTISIMSDNTYTRRKVKHPIDMVEEYNKQGYDVFIVEIFRDVTVLKYSVAVRRMLTEEVEVLEELIWDELLNNDEDAQGVVDICQGIRYTFSSLFDGYNYNKWVISFEDTDIRIKVNKEKLVDALIGAGHDPNPSSSLGVIIEEHLCFLYTPVEKRQA